MNDSSESESSLSKKRFRQTSLLESFSFTKRIKTPGELTYQEKFKNKGSMASLIQETPPESSSTCNLASLQQDMRNQDSIQEENLNDSNLSEDLFPASSSLSQECSPDDKLSQDIFAENGTTDSDTQPYPEISEESILCVENLPLNRTPKCSLALPPLWSDSNHMVLFNCNIMTGKVPKPYPISFRDSWDGDHVRMPCSPMSMYPVKDRTSGKETLQARWDIIERNLLKPIASSLDLKDAILSYNSQYENRWGFEELNRFFTETLEPQETQYFFSTLLPKIVELALQLPICCTHPIPLLKRGRSLSITLSQRQISCLLANAFFCTFPRRNSQGKNSEYSTYPDINFNRLFTFGNRDCKGEKLKCILNYFKRVTQNVPTGVVTYERRYCDAFPYWTSSKKKLQKLYVSAEGFIESDGNGLLQVDFANKNVGGGVLSSGCVQEEIRFLICPELLVSRLFTERLGESEVLVVTGCERFNDYSGYGDSFAWEGDFVDCTPRDNWSRICTQVVAMDALLFHDKIVQYSRNCIGRELNKAFCAFYEPGVPGENLSGVATGNWGCGAFRGDPRLKALIQLLATSQANRDLVYFTFGDKQLRDDIESVYLLLSQKGTTVGQLWSLLLTFCSQQKPNETLYSFIYDNLNGKISLAAQGNTKGI